MLERLEERENPAPLPSVVGLAAAGTTQPLLGEAVNFNFNFANLGDADGFAPFLEVAVDTSGPDGTAGGLPVDGIGTPAVTAANLPLAAAGSVTLVAGQTQYTNPLTGELRTINSVFGAGRFNAGDTIYFYALPFGSFTGDPDGAGPLTGQTTAVTVALPTSNRADVNSPLPVSVVGGFRDNEPSLNGPGIYGPTANTNITPQLYRLNKIYQGPESETATGPNYVRRYRLEVDVATGQVVSNLVVTDALANTMQLVGRNTTSVAGAPNIAAFLNSGGTLTSVTNLANLTTTGGAATGGGTTPTTPGGTLAYNFLPTGTYTGRDGVDAAFEFNFYVPRDADPAGNPVAPDPTVPTVPQGTDSTTAINTTSSLLDWTPIDTRDGPLVTNVPPAVAGSTLAHVLEQQSIAVQKTVARVDPATGAVIAPGSPILPGITLLRYTIDFQVSDYFAFDDVFLQDVLSDGQRLYLGSINGVAGAAAPTLSVNNAFVTGGPGSRTSTSGAFAGPGTIDYERRYTLQSALPPGTNSDPTTFGAGGPGGAVYTNTVGTIDGTTRLQFDISGELRARPGTLSGRLVGGEIGNDGTGPTNNPRSAIQFGATTGTIVFYAQVSRDFSDDFPSGDRPVNQGDVLGNRVDDPTTPVRDGVFGDQLAAATINAANPSVIGRGSDDSGTSVAIPYGVQSKQIYAINGQVVPAQTFANPPYSIQAGDQVTYKLTYTLPISRFEQLRLIDFPPLPVIAVGASGPYTFTRDPAGYGFGVGEVGVFDPAGAGDDTFFATFAPGAGNNARNPALTTNAGNNSLTADFGDFADPLNRSTTISLLVTFRVSNAPFAADLFLTNQFRVAEGSTNAGDATVEDLRRFELVRPVVTINKGVVGTVAGGVAAGSTLGGIGFPDPTQPATFGGTVDTAAEATAIGAPNASNLDAGDRVRFAIVAQNTDKGDAFDVRIRDAIPAGYVVPATFAALAPRVYRGDGTLLALGADYTLISYDATTGTFEIELTDNYSTGNVGGAEEDARSGALSRGLRTDQTLGNVAITNGSNTVVVLYDLTLAQAVTPTQALTNVASVPVYSNSETGPDLTDPTVVPGGADPTNPAVVTVRNVAATKTVVSTSEASTLETGDGSNGNPRLATIGEVVRYRLVVQLPEGSAGNVQIRDNLPAGLTFLDDNTATVAFVSNQTPISATTPAGATLALGFGAGAFGTPPWLSGASGAITPTFLLTDARIGSSNSLTADPDSYATGSDVFFKVGDLVNADSDADAEFVVIEFNALVDNSAAGSNDAGDPLDNTAAVFVGGSSLTTSGNYRVRVVEPAFTLNKTVTPTAGDAGDTVTFTVAFSNANGANNTTAFDVNLTDVVPLAGFDNVAIVPMSLATTGTVTNGILTVVGNSITYTADSLSAGASVTFQFTALLVASVGPGDYTNTANVTYTSLPGANGTTANPTGSPTPGAPGTDTGERTGTGTPAQNDYFASDPATVTVLAPLAKTIVGTNQAFTLGNTVAVGEQVQYQVVITIPEGTVPLARLLDSLPTGLAVVSLDSLTFAGALTTDVAGGFPAVLTNARAALNPPGRTITFDLGTVVNADRDPDAETITLTYTAVVLNAGGNQRGTALTNSATFRSGGVDRSTISAANVTVAEPTLQVVKTASPTTGDASTNPADAVTFTLVISHAGASNADAFDVALSDVVPAGFTYVAGSLTNTGGLAPTAFGEAGGTITASYATFIQGATSTLTFRALLNGITSPAQTVTNTAAITYTSLPGVVSAPQSTFNAASVERTGADGPGGLLNDYATSDPAAVTVNTNSISGNVYRDLDNDGVRGGVGETLIAGAGFLIEFQLTGTDNLGTVIAPGTRLVNTMTGMYTFTGLRPGTYVVTQLTQPAGFLDGKDAPGTGNLFGGTTTPGGTPRDADAIATIVIGLGGNKDGVNYDFGELPPAALGDLVWEDFNGNGRRDAGDAGLNAVPVTLTGTNDLGPITAINTATAPDGTYSFGDLRPGTYAVTFGTLAGYVFTVPDSAVATDATDSDAGRTPGPTFGRTTSSYTLAAGQTDPTVDAGLYRPVSLGNRVFYDPNANGLQDNGEPGISGVGITVVWHGPDGVLGGGDDLPFATTTGADGIWGVPNLPTGSYTVTAAPPAGSGFTSLTDSIDNNSLAPTNPVVVSTTSGVDRVDVDFGYRGTASLGDRVYLDIDSDGVQDTGEPGLSSVQVRLTWAGSDGLLPGELGDTGDDLVLTTTTGLNGLYSFPNLPAGRFRVSVIGNLPDNVISTDALDDNVLSPGGTAVVSLTTGQARTDVDFGYVGNASVGDRVYIDQNRDGVQQLSEPGIPGATVRLVWAGPDGAIGGANAADDVTFTTTTGANGLYLFPGLPVYGPTDPYQVAVTAVPIAGLNFTDSLDDAILSPTNPVGVTVSGTVGDPFNARRDVDFGYDGAGSLAGTVYRDDNNNGIQDGAEPGIAGVRVTLTGVDVLGNPVLDPATGLPYTTLTGATGGYLFATVLPGVYTITETQPAAYGDGLDVAGSLGGNVGDDVTRGVPVALNDAGVRYDFGERPAAISGTVFRDDSRDGTPQPGEPRLPGVRVELRDPNTNALLTFTTTDGNGFYSFPNLPAGDYRVVEVQPAGYADGPVGPATTRDVTLPTTGLTDQNFAEVLGRLSGTVYIDADNGGTRQAGEPGIPGVSVTLTGTTATGTVVNATVFTDALGQYAFPNLFPADANGYTISEGSAAPFTDRASNVGTGAATPGTSTTPNTIAGVNLTPGQAGIDYDFGEVRPAAAFIAGTVYRDDSRDGGRQPAEPGIPGVTVRLLDGTGNVIATTLTGATGNYLFPNLTPGLNYQVLETQPGAYGNSPVGPTVLIPVPALPPTGSTGNDFGEVFGSLAGAVYFDTNRDGGRQPGEPPIPGVTVTLTGTDVNGTAVNRTTTTDAAGNYLFTLLPAGVYAVAETQPTNYADGGETVGTAGGATPPNDVIAQIPLGGGVNATTYDFGEVGVPVSGTVFFDADRDGTLDGGEPPIPGVTVRLVDATGTVVGTTTTDAAGNYLFPNVAPGTYSVVEIQPAGYGDPLAGPFAPNTRPITVISTAIVNQNYGDTLGTLAGVVYVDANDDGINQGGEAGIGGVAVRLDAAGADGVFGTPDDVVGFRATATSPAGTYQFTNLPTGVYRVVEPTQPAPYLDGRDTPGAAGGDATTNDRITAIPLAAGVDLTAYNFGERLPANPFIAGTVYLDGNANGTRDPGEPPLAGVTVTLTGPGGTTVTTDANGNYLFPNLTAGATYTVTETQPAQYASGPQAAGNAIAVPNLPPTGSTNNDFGETPGTISGIVYFDRDASAGLNAGDTPLPGVTVALLDSAGNPVLDPATGVAFARTTDVNGAYSFTGLAAGTYRVVETQPAGFNQGTNTPGTGGALNGTDRIDVVLPAGGNSPANNFGEVGAPISGRVWLDPNADGVRDPAETTGIGGVTITLLDAAGTVVGTRLTNPIDGTYSFTNLPPGNYTLVQTQPPRYGSSTANLIPVTLTPAGVVNQDFGETLGRLAGTVYADANNNGTRDPGERPISGVTVTLTGTDVGGTAVVDPATNLPFVTTTDAAGNYLFTNLPAGTYTITETQPTAYFDGQDAIGTAGGRLAPTDTQTAISLGAGAAAVAYDFGEVTSSLAGIVYRDFDLGGTFTPAGVNPDTGIGGVTITLTGTDTDGRPVSFTTTTAADGSYLFAGLGAGAYTLTETQPPLPTTLFDGFYDGLDNPGSLGGTVPVKNRLAVTLGAAQDGTAYNFGELPPADPFGFVYVDANRNGVMDATERGLPNVPITISGTAFAGTIFARPLTAADVPGGFTHLTDAAGRYEFSPIPPGLYRLTESVQPRGFADGLEQDGDPNGPAATVGNDFFADLLLAPFPIRGPFNFGEILLPGASGPLPPFDFFPLDPFDPSKRSFLGSTDVPATPPAAPTGPNFGAFSPGERPTAFATVAEEGGNGWVRVFDFAGGVERFRFQPFGDFAGGARLATADVTGDGIPDIIAAAGPGGGPVVKVFDGNTGELVRSFMAFDPDFRGGLRVAAGDFNGDFIADIVVTPDGGGGPIVKVFDGATGATLANFFALDPDFRGGLRIAAGDVNRDGTPDLIVTAGEGGGPRIAVYDGTTLFAAPTRLAGDFFGFAPELRSGQWVSAADVDGDGFADIVLGSGPGAAPRVVAYSGRVLAEGGGPREVASFFAGAPAARTGARVMAADLDGDGRAEVMAAGGTGDWPIASVYDPLTGRQRDAFYAFPARVRGGVYVG